jgi:hypothetical protein
LPMAVAPSHFHWWMKPRAPRSRWRFFPLPKAGQVPVAQIQRWLKEQMVRWGKPNCLRVDNGWPWGSGQDLPPVLSLWLLGQGCQVRWNRPGHPQENGIVERFQGLQQNWGEPERCENWQAWTERMEWVVKMQREVYPAVNGQSRMAAHPELRANPRRGADPPAAEWELSRVLSHLGQGRWVRQVGKKGQISLYHRPWSVGSRLAGQQVWVRLDVAAKEWVVVDGQGKEVKRREASELTAERIQALDISYVKPHQARRREERQKRQNLLAHFVT